MLEFRLPLPPDQGRYVAATRIDYFPRWPRWHATYGNSDGVMAFSTIVDEQPMALVLDHHRHGPQRTLLYKMSIHRNTANTDIVQAVYGDCVLVEEGLIDADRIIYLMQELPQALAAIEMERILG